MKAEFVRQRKTRRNNEKTPRQKITLLQASKWYIHTSATDQSKTSDEASPPANTTGERHERLGD